MNPSSPNPGSGDRPGGSTSIGDGAPAARTCRRCGEPLRKQRLPFTLKEVMTAAGLAALATALLLRFRYSEAGLGLVIGFTIIAIPMGGLWLAAHLGKRVPRCLPCGVSWRPSAVLSHHPVSPWAVLGAFALLILCTPLFALLEKSWLIPVPQLIIFGVLYTVIILAEDLRGRSEAGAARSSAEPEAPPTQGHDEKRS